MSTHGIMQSPAPGNSSARDLYIASISSQSSKVTSPQSSSHQYFAHQSMLSVALRTLSNSRNRLLSFARMAGCNVVPWSRSCSSSDQNVGRSSSGRNLMYSVSGLRTPTSFVSGQQMVACSSKKTSTAPLVVCNTISIVVRIHFHGSSTPFQNLREPRGARADGGRLSQAARCSHVR
jgi:hypothetical protein